MNKLAYVKQTLAKYGLMPIPPKRYYYLRSYHLLRLKRAITHTLMIFIFQYLSTNSLPFLYPPLPIYPPLAIAFAMYYLLGNTAIPGLLLGSLCAYYLKGFSLLSIILYLIADVGMGCFGATLCQAVFSSDIKPFENIHERMSFIKINCFITSLLSSLFKFTATVVVTVATYKIDNIDLNYKALFYDFINLWLADLNAILVFSGFLLSWVYVPFSREKILPSFMNRDTTSPFIIFILLTIFFILLIVFSVLLINKLQIIFVIALTMCLSIYFAYQYKYLIATGLLFIHASLYLVYFIVHQQEYLIRFGIELYTLIPISLFIYSIFIIYLGCSKKIEKNEKILSN